MSVSLTRKAAMGAVVMGIFAVSPIVAPATAEASGTSSLQPPLACDGFSCYGYDPATTVSSIDGQRCDAGAYTPAGAGVATPQGYVELSYGPHCHAKWARISGSSPGTWFWVQSITGSDQQSYLPADATEGHTRMVNGYPTARAGDIGGHTAYY